MQPTVSDRAEVASRNRTRTRILQVAKAKQFRISRGLEAWTAAHQNEIPAAQALQTQKFIEKTYSCSYHNIFRRHKDGAVFYHSSHTCKHRVCQVCNLIRKKKVRQKFREMFEHHPELFERYDLMHVMLSVPHTVAGWKGQQMYATELIEHFKELRRRAGWKNHCAGGVMNTEVTRNADGLHVHLHILAFVEKAPQNRNSFYRAILTAWNQLTKWEGSKRQAFSLRDLRGIRKSIGLFAAPGSKDWKKSRRKPGNVKKQVSEIMARLDPTGSTVIHVQNLFFWQMIPGQPPRKVYKLDTTDKKMRGVMECLKYHFKPVIWDKEASDNGQGGVIETTTGKETNYPLISEVIYRTHGLRMYGRFGILLDPKQPYGRFLRLMDSDDDPEAEGDEDRSETVYHPDTLLPCHPHTTDYLYTDERLTKIGLQLAGDEVTKMWSYERRPQVLGATLDEAHDMMKQIVQQSSKAHSHTAAARRKIEVREHETPNPLIP